MTARRVPWGLLAVAGWLGLALAGLFLTPDETPSPTQSEFIFGKSPSIQSSAPGGALALSRVLTARGYRVTMHQTAAPPRDRDAVLMLLEPRLFLADEEVAALMVWVRHGGRLVYAPRHIPVTVEGVDHDIPLDDPLLTSIEHAGVSPRAVAATWIYALGDGLVAVLPGGAEALGNDRLKEAGLASELPWLREVLADRSEVAFDEARLGAVAPLGPWDLLRHSPFGAAIQIALLALLVALLGLGVRRTPALPEPVPGGRVFGEHLDAVAGLLERGNRVALASRALLQGTTRRLAGLAASEHALSELERVRETLAAGDGRRLAGAAERLRRLENELGGKSLTQPARQANNETHAA